MPNRGSDLPPKSIVAAIAGLYKQAVFTLRISYTLVSKSNVPKFGIRIGMYVE